MLFFTLTVREEDEQSRIHHHHSEQELLQVRSDLDPSRSLSWNTSFNNGLTEVHVEYYQSSNKPLWEHSPILPPWMKNYFVWHRQQRQFLHQHRNQWHTLRYYLVECTERYPNCGGAADRLGPLPFHVQFAAASRRLILYHWTTPAPLESFLLPPRKGVDWRLPSWLHQHFDNELSFPNMRNRRHRKNKNVTVALDLQDLVDSLQDDRLLVRAKIQSHDHGASNFDDMVFWKKASFSHQNDRNVSSFLGPTFQQVFHDLWRVFFTPTPIIASKIHEQMTFLGLYPPGSYIAMHLRVLYGKRPLTDAEIVSWTRNMIHCTLQYLVPVFHQEANFTTQRPTIPTLLFVSDSKQATNEAVKYGEFLRIPLVARSTAMNQNPLHLEKDVRQTVPAQNGSTGFFNVDELYDTFIDIYTLGLSQCVAYQAGGFGRWGSMMSYNSTCFFFLKPAKPEICHRPELDGRAINKGKQTKPDGLPLFLPPFTT
ncbi:hypothetical protein IV203_033027 [Nitzschia inconspicua]|uniref:Uncharacterized protein n=1 Tax=Nitzschia inconspicua TaxID=303405 RepID=A0A9K3KLE8_9STRA|nr:hypothetical protein IV203_033027 [Nitzschia inconspicua]